MSNRLFYHAQKQDNCIPHDSKPLQLTLSEIFTVLQLPSIYITLSCNQQKQGWAAGTSRGFCSFSPSLDVLPGPMAATLQE